MSNEQEYIELFDSNRALIEEPCAELLNRERAKAYTAFKAMGFPSGKEELYRYTDVRPIFAENYGMNLGRLDVPINPREIFSCDVPNLHTHQEYIVNDNKDYAHWDCFGTTRGIVKFLGYEILEMDDNDDD